MGELSGRGAKWVNHFAPLHYLVFIGRSRKLMSKPALVQAGFAQNHFRSMSKQQDVRRGFERYVHLTLDEAPRILKAKLTAGFPHFCIRVPTSSVESAAYDLCRYNVAMTRQLRREGKTGFPESRSNGRYYAGMQIPVARTRADKAAMLAEHHRTRVMIEVLVLDFICLPDDTQLVSYAPEDETLARKVLDRLMVPWEVVLSKPPGPYPRNAKYAQQVAQFVDRALSDPTWLGNGLEFDRV